jgi:hypothetical protein
MKSYRISSQNAQAERSKALKRSAFLGVAAILVGILLGGRAIFQEHEPRMVLAFALFCAAFLTVGIWRSLRRTSRFLDEAYSSFEIADDDKTWTKRQKNTPDVTLARSEVLRIEEWQGKGFRICTADRNKNIWVPCELDGYEQLRSEVLAVPGMTITSKSAAWLRSYFAIAALLTLFALSVLAREKWIAVVASLVLATWLLTLFVRHYRNPNLTVKGRRQFLWVAFVGICMLVRAIVIWRS